MNDKLNGFSAQNMTNPRNTIEGEVRNNKQNAEIPVVVAPTEQLEPVSRLEQEPKDVSIDDSTDTQSTSNVEAMSYAEMMRDSVDQKAYIPFAPTNIWGKSLEVKSSKEYSLDIRTISKN